MTKILLLSAAYLNGGAYVDAGAEVPVGDGAGEMTEERAIDMVAAKLAEEVPDGETAGDEASDGAAVQKTAARSTARGK
jgi:topoisomerase IA-like protein